MRTAWGMLSIEEQWRAQLIQQYGRGANEELFCIPSKGGDALFQRGWFTIVEAAPSPVVQTARAWDIASTELKPLKKNNPDWAVGQALRRIPAADSYEEAKAILERCC
ncbi:MAG: hypothetical protein QM778_35215 [Myxococcales bacterium]